MKTLVKILGAVAVTALVTACGPDMKTINSASERAEADASAGVADVWGQAGDSPNTSPSQSMTRL